jgi:Asp-tRNA(Asn)/Glu-tRNA(Gln) amidotransferase A subunit family amidase
MAKGLLRRFLDNEASLNTVTAAWREREADIQAWLQWNPQPGSGRGPLAGVPFGVKDIFDVAGLRSEWGSQLFAGRVAQDDSGVVRTLRECGAVVLGKTHTTAFAYFDAAPTRNPHDLKHTPGGSSSGSAAAVAAGMAAFALGSQTQGSMLRPASYCGVVGFKPGFGLLPLEGVMPFAPSLDTAGLFTQTAEDMRLLWERIGYDVECDERARLGALPMPEEVEGPMRVAVWRAVEQLGIRWVRPPDSWHNLYSAVTLIQEYEGARTHRQTFERHGEAMGAKLAGMIRRGLDTPRGEYLAARERVAAARRDLTRVALQSDVLLSPAALGPAPRDLTYTGDPRMNSPWTGLGVPSISIPMPVEGGLPLGLQMVAPHGKEALLLKAACELEAALPEVCAVKT